MHLFTRVGVLRGNQRAGMAWATETTAYVSNLIGRQLSLWVSNFGNPVGTVAWSLPVESHADFEAAFTPLFTDDGFDALAEKGRDLVTQPMHDHLRQVIHGSPTGEPPAVGSVAILTTALAANGKLEETIVWGIEIADHVTAVTSSPVMFCADSYGAFGQLTWIGGAASSADVDRINSLLEADVGYMKMLSSSADLFVAGSGRRSFATRVA